MESLDKVYRSSRCARVVERPCKSSPHRRLQIGASKRPRTGIAQIRWSRAAWPQRCAWKRGETALRAS